jgi:hypothetical protein
LAVWDLAARQCKQTMAQSSMRGAIQRMQFSRLTGDATLAVLYANALVLWDAAQLTPIQQVGHRIRYLEFKVVK